MKKSILVFWAIVCLLPIQRRFIIISEVKMEFRLNAMEISLKKVLGYRFYERHKRFISVNLLENIAVGLAEQW